MKTHLATTTALVLLALASCALPVATGPSATPPAQKVLSVVLDDPQASRRAIGSEVKSIAILVLRDNTGACIGSGTLTKSGSLWSGDVSVSTTGSAVVNAYLRGTDGLPLGFGTSPVTITGTGDKVQVTATTSRLLGGNLVSADFAPPPSPTTSWFAGAGGFDFVDGAAASAQFYTVYSATTDGTNLYVADYAGLRRVAIATGQVSTVYKFTEKLYEYVMAVTCDGTDLYAGTQAGDVYRVPLATGEPSALYSTSGPIRALVTDGRYLYVASDGSTPGTYELCRVALSGGPKDSWSLKGAVPAVATALGFDGTDLIVAESQRLPVGLYRVSRSTGTSTQAVTSTMVSVKSAVCIGSSVYLLNTDYDAGGAPKSGVMRWKSGDTTLTSVVGNTEYQSATDPNYDWYGLTVIGSRMFYLDQQGSVVREIVSGRS